MKEEEPCSSNNYKKMHLCIAVADIYQFRLKLTLSFEDIFLLEPEALRARYQVDELFNHNKKYSGAIRKVRPGDINGTICIPDSYLEKAGIAKRGKVVLSAEEGIITIRRMT